MVDITTISSEPIVKMVNITKRFGGVYAVKNVDLELYRGEILGLVGGNGAGKSTLIKVLSGAYLADEGEIYVNGQKVQIESPKDSRKLGIETLYQDLALIDNLDLFENIFIARELIRDGILGKFKILDSVKMKKEGIKLLNKLGITIEDPNSKVKYLSGGQRQMVATSRAIYFNAQVIVMDEPTAALGVAETQKVHDLIKKLQKNNVSIVIISHNINEVFNIADRFMVLKTGTHVATKRKSETSISEILKMIIAGKNYKDI